MGLFYLIGNGPTLLKAIELGLEAVDGRWQKFYPCRRRKRALGKTPSVPLQRPFDNGRCNDQQKAVEYARWLAERDGIAIPEEANRFCSVSVNLKI